MAEYIGSHGTSADAYSSILKTGWRPAYGRRQQAATGIYFWYVDEQYLKEFAINWAQARITNYIRAGHQDCEAVALKVKIEVDEGEVKDFTDRHKLEQIQRSLSRILPACPKNKSAMQHLQDYYIEFRRRQGIIFKMAISYVQTPHSCKKGIYELITPALIVLYTPVIKSTEPIQ